MHFEILVEDISGKTALEILVPKIIGNEHTFYVHAYKGIGRIPKNLRATSDPQKRILLDQLPRLIRGYGKTFAGYGDYPSVLIVVCDLDSRCLSAFRRELFDLVNRSDPKPDTYFCIAVEEGEAWYLGDMIAVKKAYPHAKDTTLNSYVNDSICNTWELLADALFSGGAKKLSQLGYQTIGREKTTWAEKITPHMDIDSNLSPSFCYFRDKLRKLTSQ
ncbi:MAG: hypothetical protein H6633_09100 [Anaerolineales bacterium]|nr:hypothetical protein [Anaerolineales bacterium]